MATVIVDAGPLYYLILIQAPDILRQLFGSVVVPDVVTAELQRQTTPSAVRLWLETGRDWLVEQPAPPVRHNRFSRLGSGEIGVLSLAAQLRADLVLIDDRDARKAAHAEGFAVSGTVGVLDRAAARGLIDLRAASDALRATNFRIDPGILDRLLSDHEPAKRTT